MRRVSLASLTMLIVAIIPFPKAASAQWATSGTNIYNTNTGNVGVNTITPAAPLHLSSQPLRIETSGNVLDIYPNVFGRGLLSLRGPGGAPATLVTGTLQATIQDAGGAVFDVKAYGAAGDGVVDDTLAIQNALGAIFAAGRGVLFFPPGTFRSSGNFNLSGLHGLRIQGAGIGATTIALAHPSNDLFFWTSELRDLTVDNFSVSSDAVTRTAGWVLRAKPSSYTANAFLKRSRIANLDIKKQVNGIWMAQYELVWLTNVLMSHFVGTDGVGLKVGQTTASDVNQGVDLYITNVSIYNNDLAGGAAITSLATGLLIEDTEAVEAVGLTVGNALTNNLRIVANPGGHIPMNHFFSQSIFDGTKTGHSVYLTGNGTMGLVMFTGCWFASAGRLPGGSSIANGLRIDSAGVTDIQMNGAKVTNNTGIGVYLSASSGIPLTLTGSGIFLNGQGNQPGNSDNMYINVGMNGVGPTISGNTFNSPGAGGVDLRTSNTTNRILVVGNRLVGGTAFGTPLVPPLGVAANNGS